MIFECDMFIYVHWILNYLAEYSILSSQYTNSILFFYEIEVFIENKCIPNCWLLTKLLEKKL